MHFDWSTLVLQTINFAILVWLLNRFLYKPMLRTIDARRAEIDRQLADAAKAQSETQTKLVAIEADRRGIASERAAALRAAALQADAAAGTRHVAAEREAKALLEAAAKTLAEERGEVLAEARRTAINLAVEVAGRLLADVPGPIRTEGWLERIVQYLARLPKEELESLTRQVTDDARLKVVTVSSLPAEAAGRWRTQLQKALGCPVTVEFEADGRLMAGADLHFSHAVIRFSWSSVLESVRSEIDVRANAH